MQEKSMSWVSRQLINNMTDPLIRTSSEQDVAEIVEEEWLDAIATHREIAI